MRLIALFLLAAVCSAQDNPAAAARKWRQEHESEILNQFVELLKIRNLASDTPNIRRNALAIQQLLDDCKVKTRILEVAGAPPVVYGEIVKPGATRTVVFYAHYDGQPLDEKEWISPPWVPELRDRSLEKDGKRIKLADAKPPFDPEWRIYARSATDDKAPIIAIVAALKSLGIANLKSNVKFVFEGEEEAGSPNLDKIVAANKELLKSDVWLMCDGPVHQSGSPQILFGARGVETLDITVYGPRRELHSGHYGNWAPNPALMLVKLLASMKDEDGRVLVDHFYDGIDPLSETERRAVAAAPAYDQELKRELWLGRTEGGGRSLVELLNLPSLNLRGMSSARIGAQASNVIPARANATIDMRLVKGIDHRLASGRVIEHIRKQGFFVVEHDPDPDTLMAHPKVARVSIAEGGYNAERTSMDLPVSRDVIRIAESVRGPVIKLPTSGGSLPLYKITGILGAPTISIPIANHDSNQHSFNENIRLGNLWDGIELMAALLSGL